MTPVIDEMFKRSKPDGWGHPMWEEVDSRAGGVKPGEGLLLYGLVRALRPEVILEVGTSHGFSGLHLAQGLRDNGFGRLHTVEVHEGRREDACLNFKRAGLDDLVQFYSAIPRLEKVDFAFLDALHEAKDVMEYLSYLPDHCKYVAIHDAEYLDHVRQAIRDTSWQMILLKGTSYAGMALLARE